jgi:hypothetical protein
MPLAGTNQNSAASRDGADRALGTQLSAVFADWDANIWNIPNGNLAINGALPTLKTVGGAQNPKLPPQAQ